MSGVHGFRDGRLFACTVLLVSAFGGCFTGGPVESDAAGASGLGSGGRQNGVGGHAGAAPGVGGAITGEPPSSSAGVGGATTALGLPCEVEALLRERCQSCHGAVLASPMPLLVYEDLAAPAPSRASATVATVALERMSSDTNPMPPGSGSSVPDAELDAYRVWVEAGLPRGSCGDGGSSGTSGAGSSAGGRAAGEAVCSSGIYWPRRDSGGHGSDDDDEREGELDDEGPWMNPGRACIACHLAEDDREPILQIGGTVFPTLHEPDLCYGVDGDENDVRVVITDASGMVFELPLETTGNFWLRTGSRQVRFPIRAKVVENGRERAMATPQNTGDCNACHTERGSNGAPGRIYLP